MRNHLKKAITITPQIKEKICRCLFGYDPDIVEIVRFGSSVYAPQYAGDLDLLLITRKAKIYGGYLDALYGMDLPFDTDVVVCEAGKRLKNSFACQVLGAFEILYGDGRHLAEITKDFDPTFEEARSHLRRAKEYLGLAEKSTNEYDKEGHIRTAFNELFHASRVASMVYLSTEETRWGRVKRRLPQPYRGKFEAFIDTLHIKYFYHGDYPEQVVEEFEGWYKRVEEFVKGLEEKGEVSSPSSAGY